ncbi:MAG: metallophosphoesterase, partial [Treponema sp.]|nr:metallophosphoesterase [Treponema sp.]
MVMLKKLCAVFFLCALPLVLGTCSVDLLGLFGTTDLDTRLEASDVFTMLSAEDRAPSLGEEYSFIVLTDTHIEEGDAHGLEQLADRIEATDKFVVVNGDITQNGDEDDVRKFVDIARSLGVPCYPVIGNHDIFSGNWPVWKNLIGSTRYRVESSDGGTTLFVLDSATGFFGAAQLNWLESQLQSANGHVFIFTHWNLFSDGLFDIDELTDSRERARFMTMLSGRCDAMFMGHIHKRILKEFSGVQYITIEDYKSNATYCRVHVSPQGLR